MNRRERRIRESDRNVNANRRKRRRNRNKRGCGCGRCLLTLVIVFIVFAGVLYGGGYFAWEQYAKPVVGISLNDALGLIGGLYSYKEDKIVTNPYGENDLGSFYANLSSALYLDSSVDLQGSLSDVLNEYSSSLLSSDDGNQSEEVSTAEEEESNGSITGNETLDAFLNDLQFDFSRLKDYEDEYRTPQVLELTDKQTAAFLDNTVSMALQAEAISSKLPEVASSLNLSSIVKIPQVVVNNEQVLNLSEVALTITVQINIREACKGVLESYNKNLKLLSNILPKSIYATITVYPNNYEAPAEIMLDDYTSEKMGKIYSVANAFLKDSEYGSINGILTMVNQKVLETIEQVQAIVPVSFVNTGSVEIKPISALMNLMGVTEITETQFFCMIRDVCLPEFSDIATNLGFEDGTQYEDVQVNLDDKMKDFIVEVNNKYAIESGYLTADTAFDTLTSVSSEDSTFTDHIDITNLDLSSSTYISLDHKVDLSYSALVGLLNSYLDNKNEDEESASSIDYSMINAYYNDTKTSLSIVLEIGVLSTLGDSVSTDSTLYTLISQLIPEHIYITATVNLTTSSTTLALNGKSVEQTKESLSTITTLCSSLGSDMSDLDYTALTTQVGTTIVDGLNDIKEKLGTEIIFTNDCAYLPNVFEVMANVAFYTEGSTDNISATDLYLTLHDLIEEMPSSFEGASSDMGLGFGVSQSGYTTSKNANLSSFINEFTTQYAIDNSDSYINNTNVYTKLTTMNDDSTLINKVDIENLDFTRGTYETEDYKVETGYLALSKILDDYINNEVADEEGKISSDNYSLINLSYSEFPDSEDPSITIRNLALMIEVDLSKMIALDETSSTYALANQILPNYVYIQANVQLDKVGDAIISSLEVIGLDNGDSTQDFFTRIVKVGTAIGTDLSSFNYDSLNTMLGENVFNGLQMLSDKLGTEVKFTSDNAYLPSVYEILSSNILYSSEEGAENLSDEEVYVVFKDLHVIPTLYQTSNKAENDSGVISEINTKYSIMEGSKIVEPTEENGASNVVDQLTSLSTSYDNVIDGATLAANWSSALTLASATTQTQKEAVKLTSFSPIATEGETAKLFDDAVTITSSGLTNIKLDSLYVVNSTTLKLIYTCTYDQTVAEGETSYAGVIPAFIVNVELDVSKISSEDSCCVVTINDMDTTTGGALDDFGLMCSRLSSSGFTVASMSSNCDTTIKTELSDLFTKMALTFATATEEDAAKIYIGSLYDVAYTNIATDSDTFTAVDLADTISALHKAVTTTGQSGITSSDEYTETPATSISGLTVTINATLTARNVGYAIGNGDMSSLYSNLGMTSGSLSLYQVGLLDFTDTTYATERTSMVTTLSNGLGAKTTGDYLVATMSVATSGTGYSSTLLPSTLYLTTIVDMSDGTVELLYNNLTSIEMDVLAKLSGDANSLNVDTAASEMETYIKGVVLVSWSSGIYSGTVTVGNVIDTNSGNVNATLATTICGEYVINYSKSVV